MMRRSLPAAISAVTAITALATNGVDDAFGDRFFDGCRRLFQLLLADDAAASWGLNGLAPLATRRTRIGDDSFFRTTFPEQADFLFDDFVFGFGDFLHVGNNPANPLQLTATAFWTRRIDKTGTARNCEDEPPHQRQQKMFHLVFPVQKSRSAAAVGKTRKSLANGFSGNRHIEPANS